MGGALSATSSSDIAPTAHAVAGAGGGAAGAGSSVNNLRQVSLQSQGAPIKGTPLPVVRCMHACMH